MNNLGIEPKSSGNVDNYSTQTEHMSVRLLASITKLSC
jgi:hypothetical protein